MLLSRFFWLSYMAFKIILVKNTIIFHYYSIMLTYLPIHSLTFSLLQFLLQNLASYKNNFYKKVFLLTLVLKKRVGNHSINSQGIKLLFLSCFAKCLKSKVISLFSLLHSFCHFVLLYQKHKLLKSYSVDSNSGS